MHKKLLLCTKCKRPYASVEVPTKRQATTARFGKCYDCNLQTLLATKANQREVAGIGKDTVTGTAVTPKDYEPDKVMILNGVPVNIPPELYKQLEDLLAAQFDTSGTVVEPKPKDTTPPPPPFAPADLTIGQPPNVPPLHMIADEPDVVEYTENGAVVYRWTKHKDEVTGQKFYQDQNGNKWYYKKL